MKRTVWLLLGACLWGCGGEGRPVTMNACDAEAAEGLMVSATDPYGETPYALGYPPYAVDGCALAYVAATGELLLRDLASGDEAVLAGADEAPRRPALAGTMVAWEATIAGKPSVRVRGPRGTTTLSGAFDHAGEPRVASDVVAFTGWLDADDGGDTDVFLFTAATGVVTAVATGPAQQRFPDVSATHVAWTDFAEDPDGVFGDDGADVADIGLMVRATGERTTRARVGKQAFPMLGAEGKLAYLDWGFVHPEPKFSAYAIRLGPLGADIEDDAEVGQVVTHTLYVRPVARGGRINWVSTDGSGATLLQRGVDLAEPVQTVNVFPSGTVFGPTASEGMTLVGTSATHGAVTLRAFTH